jgi:hypothetical protein
MLISASFEARKGNANDGKIYVSFADDEGTGGSVTCAFEITNPAGVVICTLAETEITFAPGGDGENSVDIPLDSLGAYMEGDYTFQFVVTGITSPIDRTDIYSYVAYNAPDHLSSDTIAWTTNLDCNTEEITAEDVTVYPTEDFTRNSRLLTVTPPVVSGASPTTSTSATVTAPVTYTNVPYQVTLDVVYSYNQIDVDEVLTFFSFGSTNLYISIDVDCDPNMCSTVKCLASKFDKLEAKATRLGGWFNLSPQDKGDFEYASTLTLLAMQLRTCGENNMAKPYIAKAKALLNCDCGCSDSTGPQPIGSANGSSSVPTNLSYEYDGASLIVDSSTGSGVTLPVATDSANGLLSSTDKAALEDAITDIATAQSDISDINSIISTADLIGINGVATANGGSTVTLGPNTSFYRLNAASGNITVVLDSTQMSIGRLYVLSAYPASGRFIQWTLNGLTTLSTGNTSNISNLISSLGDQINYTVVLFRIATTVYATVLKDTIVTS